MHERNYEEILTFFQELLKHEIDGGVETLRNDLNNINQNNHFASIMKSDYSEKYNFLTSLDDIQFEQLLNTVQDSISFSFYYFFKRLEEGENIEMGERVNFELTAVNEETGNKTKLISATPDEDGIDNDFQEWIMDNCHTLNNKTK